MGSVRRRVRSRTHRGCIHAQPFLDALMCVRSVHSVHSQAVVKSTFGLFRSRYSRTFFIRFVSSFSYRGALVTFPFGPWGVVHSRTPWVCQVRVRSILVGLPGPRVPFPCSLGGVGLVEMLSPEVVGVRSLHSLTLWWSLGYMSVGCFRLLSIPAPSKRTQTSPRNGWTDRMAHGNGTKAFQAERTCRLRPIASQYAWDGTRPPSWQGSREWIGTAHGNGQNAHES